MKQCFPFRVLGGSPASARKRWVSGFFCQKLHQKTFGWWLMVRYRFFFCGLVFFWCLVVENQNVKSFCIYIYMTYLRILVAQLLFHDEVYLLSSLSIWRKAFGGSCFFSLPGGHDGGAAWKVRFGGAFSRRIFSWWMMIPYDWFDLYIVTCGDVINDFLIDLTGFVHYCLQNFLV